MTMITPVSTPPARPGSVPLRPATGAAPPAPRDRVDLAEAPDAPSKAFLLAAVALAVATAGAIVAGLPAAPAAISQQVKVQDPSRVPDPLDHQEMKALSQPGPFDGPSAKSARQRYGRLADQARQEARIFTRDGERLARAGAELENWTLKGAGASGDIRVEGDTVTRTSPGEILSVTFSGKGQTVREELVEGGVTTLEVTPEGVTVTRAGTSRQVTRDGTFRVVGPDGTLEVSGASLRHVTKDVHRGYAGDITVETDHRFSVPEISVLTYPRTVMTESRVRTETDSVSGKAVTTRKTVEVRDDGSARVAEDRGGVPDITEEPSAREAIVAR